MNKILFVNACVRPDSRTYRLAQGLLGQLSGTVEEINLEQAHIEPLNWKTLQERDAGVNANDFSSPVFQYAKQFAEADEIVIAAPYWDLAFPSTVRIYLEAVTVTGLTFKYAPEGYPIGLCKARKLHYVTTSGGAIGDLNFGFDYIKALAEKFYGIEEALCYKAENMDIRGNDAEAILKEALSGYSVFRG